MVTAFTGQFGFHVPTKKRTHLSIHANVLFRVFCFFSKGKAKEKESNLSGNSYGYIAVKAGTEKKTVAVIKSRYPEIDAYAISQIKHKSVNGNKSFTSEIMLPGYIVFCANDNCQFIEIKRIQSVNKVLTYDDNSWSLKGNDLCCAKWLVDNNGVIGISTVLMQGDNIQIVDGPLESIRGKIVRIDKRNRNALVEMNFMREIKVWLAFEWLEQVKTY